MSILPEQERENDKKTLTKEEIHEQNKKAQHDANAHNNQHAGNNGEGHNPIHNDIARK